MVKLNFNLVFEMICEIEGDKMENFYGVEIFGSVLNIRMGMVIVGKVIFCGLNISIGIFGSVIFIRLV